jgi:thiopeptide-type bacteriocin biosynthesis protein
MKVCSHMEAKRREVLAENVAEAVSRFYTGQRQSFHLGYVVERAIQAIEAGIREQERSEHWIYFRVAVEPANRSRMIVFDIAGSIAESSSVVPITQWWWLNKWDPLGSAVRLRLQVPFDRIGEAEGEVASRLRRRGLKLSVLCYEPELRLFGGAEGIRIAHEFFAYDSGFLVDWARQSDAQQVPMIPPGLSLALMIEFARASGLDLFELWDLFDRVAAKRAVSDEPVSLKCKDLAARVIAATPDAVFSLYGDQQPLLSPYRARLHQCAGRLSRAFFQGDLECGVRESLAAMILFHWNRVGLPSKAQAALSRSAADEFARLSRKGTE